MKRTTKFFTFDSIENPPPDWLTFLFRASFIIATCFSIWSAGTSLFDAATKNEVSLVLDVISFALWSLGRLAGVVSNDNEDPKIAKKINNEQYYDPSL